MNELLFLATPVAGLFVIFIVKQKIGKPSKAWQKNIINQLTELNQRSLSSNPTILKSILIDADKLLDHTMKMTGLKGNSMGDRLKHASKYFKKKDYDNLWKAHKTRNVLVHEVNAMVSNEEIKEHYKHVKGGINTLLK